MLKYIKFSLKSSPSKLYIFITILLLNVFHTNLSYYFFSNVYANSKSSSYSSLDNHRLENFILSTRGKDNWTRMMLAIMNGVPAVEKILKEDIAVNIRGTDKFAGVTPLIFASSIGKQATVELLIKKNARLNDTDSLGKTALIHATKKGHLEIVTYLINKGANPNAQTNQKWTALMYASKLGNIEILNELLKHGAKVDAQNYLGMTPKMYASKNGHLEIVKLLLEKGAKVDLISRNGSNSLIWATRAGHEKIAELLIEEGAKMDFLESEFKRSPLLLAAMYGRESTVKKLLSSGANLAVIDSYGANALMLALNNNHLKISNLLIKAGISIDTPDKKNRTPLMIAVSVGSLDLTRFLINKGADVNARNINKKTALMIASEKGYLDIVKLLIQEKGRLDLKDRYGRKAWNFAADNEHLKLVEFLSKKEINNQSNLFYAVSHGLYGVVKVLLNLNVNTEVFDDEGWTPLMWAANNNLTNIVQILLEKGALLNGSNGTNSTFSGWTPLMLASGGGHLETVKTLVNNGADLGVKDNDKWTALTWASLNGNADVLSFLINKGSQIDSLTSDDATPLIWASSKGHENVVKNLLDKGANIKLKDIHGKTALAHAVLQGHFSTARLLIKKGANINQNLLYASKRGYKEMVDFLLKENAEIDYISSKNETALELAFKGKHTQTAKLLLSRGANTSLKNSQGQTSLMNAVLTGKIGLVKLLLNDSKKFPIDLPQINSVDFFGNTPLMTSATHGYLDIVNLLLGLGANIETRNRWKESALMLASSKGFHEIVIKLLEHGANYRGGDVNEKTALLRASQNGHLFVVKTLLSNGANIHINSFDLRGEGGTALIQAARNGHYKVLQELLNAGSIIDDTEMMFHHTALMVASLNGHEKTVDLLLKAGANPLLKDTSGRTAFLLAASNNHLSVIKNLLGYIEKTNHSDLNGNSIWHLIAMSDFSNDGEQKDLEASKKIENDFLIMKNFVDRGIILDSFNNNGDTALMIAVKSGIVTKIKKFLALGALSNKSNSKGESAISYAETSGNLEILSLLKNTKNKTNINIDKF